MKSAEDRVSVTREVKIYLRVFYALMVATVLTVGVSYLHIGHEDSHAGNLVVGLAIAGFKAFLVAGFFMHLMSEKLCIYAMLAFTAVFCAGLMALTVWATYDLPEMSEVSRLPSSAGPALILENDVHVP